MSGGIMDRFRSMQIATGSVLAGHIIAGVGRNLLTTAVVVGVAAAIGFRAEPVTGLGSTVARALLWCIAIAATFLGAATWGFRRRRT